MHTLFFVCGMVGVSMLTNLPVLLPTPPLPGRHFMLLLKLELTRANSAGPASGGTIFTLFFLDNLA